jgi:hypothetical protein
MVMKKLVKKLKIFIGKESIQKSPSRAELQKRVETGTERAVKEYGYVFKKLAEFDRS